MQQMTLLANSEDTDIKNNLDVTVKSESSSDRDAGFYSGEDTDFDVQYHSPIQSDRNNSDFCKESADGQRNKRKCSDPKRIHEILDESEPKRKKSTCRKIESSDCDDFYFKATKSSHDRPSPFSTDNKAHDDISSFAGRLPFRPWNVEREVNSDAQFIVLPKIPSEHLISLASPYQEEPLALVVEKKHDSDTNNNNCRNKSQFSLRVETDEQIHGLTVDNRLRRGSQTFSGTHQSKSDQTDSDHNRYSSPSSTTSSSEDKYKSSHTVNSGHQKQRNYKNMTRKRRIEANARERTRVHLISDAFRTLRKSVPAYADNQKLSKLSVLRIACSYIMTLSRIAGYDYSADQSAPSVSECIGSVSNTIQMEGKTRRKKDE